MLSLECFDVVKIICKNIQRNTATQFLKTKLYQKESEADTDIKLDCFDLNKLIFDQEKCTKLLTTVY